MDASRETRRRGGPVCDKVGLVDGKKWSLPSGYNAFWESWSLHDSRIGVISRRFLVSRVSYCVFGFLALFQDILFHSLHTSRAGSPSPIVIPSIRAHVRSLLARASSPRDESDARGFLPRTGHEIRMKSRDRAPIDPPKGHAFSQSAFIKC